MGILRHKRSLFDGVPGPSPWYLHGDAAPPVVGFEWQQAGDRTFLIGPDGPVAVFGYYNWVMGLDDDTLLIWHQVATDFREKTAPVVFSLFRPREAAPLPQDYGRLGNRTVLGEIPACYGSDPLWRVELGTDVVGEVLGVDFPEPLRSVDELLLWCHSSAIDRPDPAAVGDVCLVVARPSTASYQLYPQDWFNYGGTDFGYQWVTRVVRDSATQSVHGEGIRVDSFVLDSSLRQLA